MVLRINGKTIENWSLEELQVIIKESEIYRENEYIDYKYNVIDPTNMGVKDLKNKILRFIKPIEISIAEDPLRILRAFRFKEQYNLTFVGNEEEILFKHKDLLNKINKQKILEERSKYKKVGGKKYDELFK